MADCKTTTKYLVYWEADDCAENFEVYPDLATARATAGQYAQGAPGMSFHIAAHVTTFRAETVVKEAS
jgi:hypothetical protein